MNDTSILRRFLVAVVVFTLAMIVAALWLRWSGHMGGSQLAALAAVATNVCQALALLVARLRGAA